MTDVLGLLVSNFATLVLAVVTAILVYVTYTLKKATDHLARSQILPRLALYVDPYYDRMTPPLFWISVVNKGIGTAFNTHVFVVGDKERHEANLVSARRDISPFSESSPNPSSFTIQGISEGTELTIELHCEDGEGYQYKKLIPTRTRPKTTTQG